MGARQVAKEQGVLPVVVLGYLKDHPESYDIILETEYKEVVNENNI